MQNPRRSRSSSTRCSETATASTKVRQEQQRFSIKSSLTRLSSLALAGEGDAEKAKRKVARFKTSRQIKTLHWGGHLRFFQAMCVCAKVPRAIEEAKRAIEEGHSVILGLQVRSWTSDNEERSDEMNHMILSR